MLASPCLTAKWPREQWNQAIFLEWGNCEIPETKSLLAMSVGQKHHSRFNWANHKIQNLRLSEHTGLGVGGK